MNAPLAVDRSQFIGGSDVAAIMGVSPWKTPLQLYEEKINGQAPVTAEKQALFNRGKRWEPIALEMLLDALEDADGVRPELVGRNQYYTDAQHPFMRSEIDAEIKHLGEYMNVEIKTVHPFSAHQWGEQGSEEVPIHYAAQAMHGLGITGRQITVVGALFGADNMIPFQVRRDEETIDAIREKERRFWHEHIVPRIPPEPSNMEDILRIFAKVNGKPVTVTDEMFEKLHNLKRIRGQISVYKREAEEIQYEVCEHICKQWGVAAGEPEDNAILLYDGQQIATWKKQPAGRIDTKALRAAHPDICKQFTPDSWTRQLRFSKEK